MNQNVSLPSVGVPAHVPEMWPVARLKPYARNARTHSKRQIQQLRESFKQFGQVWPILVRADGTIIAGHGRIEAAKAEGFTEVRVIVAAGWTEEQCRAFGVLDNKVALNSEWDETLLGVELAELGVLGIDPALMGFEPDEVAALTGTGGHTGLTDPDEAPEPPVNPVARVGDLWALGRHRLLCGDATKADDVARVLAGVKPHLMVTDPPYGVDYDPDWRNRAPRAGSLVHTIGATAVGKVANDDRADWREAVALFPGDVAYVWHGALNAPLVAESLLACGFVVRAHIVWVKDRMIIGRGHYHWHHEPCWYSVKKGKTGHWSGDRTQTTVWQIAHRASETGHSTQKPVECMKRPIENNSSPGQAVYDPFVGSGTTIIAAEMTGRVCHSIEINPAYIDVCIKRWQDFTGQKSTLDGDGRDFESVAAERLLQAA